MSDSLSIGTSALSALQRAISTTGHNIANVNTEGYSKQSVIFGARPPQDIGVGFLGSGTQIESIDRAYNQFLTADVQTRTASSSFFQLYATTAGRVDELLADPSTSLSEAMDSFFAAAEAVSNSPTSLPERQVMLSEAETLVQRFQYVVGRVDDVATELNSRIDTSVAQINQLSENIAVLNAEITNATARGTGVPNDLLDQRDLLITRLSSLVRTTTQSQEDGALNVFIGRGQPLVIGARAETLTTEIDPQLSGTLKVTLTSGTSTSGDISDSLSGGELGAALSAAEELIEPTRRELNLLAAGFAETFNAIQEGGDDLQGVDGVPFFTEIEGVVEDAAWVDDGSPNSGNANVTFAVTDVTQLTGDSYELEYTAGGVTLKNLTTNTVTTLGGSPATVDGFEITYDPLVLSPGAGANEGDAFIIDPVFQAARLISVEIDDPGRIAAAADGQAAGNNENVLAMIELQDQSLLKGGTTSFTDMYSSLVTDVAVRTQRAKSSAETEETLLSSAIERQSSLQGVSLDEEAANLIRFQQAYQAAAQIVAVAGEVFDTLIAATSR